MTKAVIFDCDGVLVESELIANRVFAEMITAAGLPVTFDECVDRYMGLAFSDCVADIEARMGRPLPAGFMAARSRRVAEAIPVELVAVPGVAELLDLLDAVGLPRAVASSSTPAEIAVRLSVTGLDRYFGEFVYSAVNVARGKPFPDIFLHAAERLGVDPGDCVVIEDSPHGVAGAHAAGMTAIGYAALSTPERLTAAGADFVVSSMARVPGLLGL